MSSDPIENTMRAFRMIEWICKLCLFFLFIFTFMFCVGVGFFLLRRDCRRLEAGAGDPLREHKPLSV